MGRLYIELFGGLRVRNEAGESMTFPPRQASTLLACIALELPGTPRREELGDKLWPNDDIEKVQGKLKSHLFTLRKELEVSPLNAGEVIVSQPPFLYLDPDKVQTDVREFEEALRKAQQTNLLSEQKNWLLRAVEGYRGELLPGFDFDMLMETRSRLSQMYFDALHDLTHVCEDEGRIAEAITWARKFLEADPDSEEAKTDLKRLQEKQNQLAAQTHIPLRQTEAVIEDQGRILPLLVTIPPPSLTPPPSELEKVAHDDRQIITPPAVPSTIPPEAKKPANEKSILSSKRKGLVFGGVLALLMAVGIATTTLFPQRMQKPTPAPPAQNPPPVIGTKEKPALAVRKGKLLVQATGDKTLPHKKIPTPQPSHPLKRVTPPTQLRIAPTSETALTKKKYPFASIQHNKQEWVKRFVGNPGESDLNITAMVTDKQGNVFFCGFVNVPHREADMFLAKYDARGNLVWQTERYDGPNSDVDRARSLTLDNQGNIYVLGDSDNGESGATNLSGLDFVLIKYGPDGKPSPTWADKGFGVGVRRFNGPKHGQDQACKMVIGRDGGIYLAGMSWNGVKDVPYDTGFDLMVVRYRPDGTQDWFYSKDGGAQGFDEIKDMAASPFGGVVVTGTVAGGVKLGADRDILTFQLSPTRTEQWMIPYNGKFGGDDMAKALAVDASGNTYVLGTTCNKREDTSEFVDMVVIKYSPRGKELWTQVYDAGANSGEVPMQITLDAEGAPICMGMVRIGGGPPDIFTVKYAPDGTRLWQDLFDGKGSRGDGADTVIASPRGDVFVAGASFNHSPSESPVEQYDGLLLHYTREGKRQRQDTFDFKNILQYSPVTNLPVKQLAMDARGNIYAVGRMESGSYNHLYVAKFHPDPLTLTRK